MEHAQLAQLAEAWLDAHRKGNVEPRLLLRLEQVVLKTVSLFPYLKCVSCGEFYVQHDGRRRGGFCSDRCRWREAQRRRRARKVA